jgi:hypothetical protein
MRKNGVYTLRDNRVDEGELTQIAPFPRETLNVYVVSGARINHDLSIIDSPSPGNGYRVLKIRSKVDQTVDLKIEWKRVDFGHN